MYENQGRQFCMQLCLLDHREQEQMEARLNFQVPAECLELVILLNRQCQTLGHQKLVMHHNRPLKAQNCLFYYKDGTLEHHNSVMQWSLHVICADLGPSFMAAQQAGLKTQECQSLSICYLYWKGSKQHKQHTMSHLNFDNFHSFTGCAAKSLEIYPRFKKILKTPKVEKLQQDKP